ncbi:uncharacterized protein galene isoform X1 [Neodiprion pinetum]|uniref:uncharacterized protein galene isoform X1 n=1 Tax=Neodiprion pinetum TaxID=441929 RepID=UPI001EDF1D63|nr:uncharacterized protein LOC124213751 isoform X1 [Neodiprion pinetum]
MSSRMEMQMMNEVQESSKCVKVLYMIWKFFACVFSHVTLISLVVAYCLLGGLAFQALEAPNEIKVRESISLLRTNVTGELWKMTLECNVLDQENWTREARGQLETFEKDLLQKMEREGWDGSEPEAELQWTFPGALFYSIIVITTIGYGHIAPRTAFGKVVTIFYAILGIPLMLLCLSSIGDVMASSFRFLYWKICCYVCTKPPRRRRGRNARGTIRQPGRYSNRTASLRRSVRVSQRSADSALGLSESVGRSSYSDMDYRYHLEGMDLATDFPSTRPSTMSRYSDIPVSSPKVKGGRLTTGTASLDRKVAVDPTEANRMPVYFNKYALDPEDETQNGQPSKVGSRKPDNLNVRDTVDEASRTNRACGTGSLPRNHHLAVESSNFRRQFSQPPPEIREPQASISTDVDSMKRSMRMRRAQSYYGPGRHQRHASPSTRYISSIGYAVHRQNYVDDFDVDYDYYTDDGALQVLKPVPIWLCVFLVVSYIFGGGFLFSTWEQWAFFDSAYFCFITLTTIGFGDFVPQGLAGKGSIALCSLYLLFGISLLAMSFNLVQEEVINNVKSLAKSLGIIKDEEGEEDEDD